MTKPAAARVGGQWATGLLEVTADVSRLDSQGRWAVALPFDGPPVCARFAHWDAATTEASRHAGATAERWRGPASDAWSTSLDATAYCAAVESIRQAIAAGDVYQANVCRVMTAELPDPDRVDIAGLADLLSRGNPAPYEGFLRLPDQGVHIACASPELFLSVVPASNGRVVRSGPIKGTGRVASDLTAKDEAENIMIVDLVRNDLSIVSEYGSVEVPELLQVQQHPGLVHLVSFVEGRLRPEVAWPSLLAATFPPGSVTGAPKLSARRLIAELEPTSRAFYCGAFGWVDADTGAAELAVAIRTFWLEGRRVCFGTGAGITWDSDPEAEWRETQLKAERLVTVASRSWPVVGDPAWQGGSS